MTTLCQYNYRIFEIALVRSVVADHDDCDVVVGGRRAAEGTDVGKQPVEQLLRRRMTVGVDRRQQALVGEFLAGRTFTRFFWQIELDGDMQPTARDIVPDGPRPPR